MQIIFKVDSWPETSCFNIKYRKLQKSRKGEDDYDSFTPKLSNRNLVECSALEHVPQELLHGGGADRLLEVNLLHTACWRALGAGLTAGQYRKYPIKNVQFP